MGAIVVKIPGANRKLAPQANGPFALEEEVRKSKARTLFEIGEEVKAINDVLEDIGPEGTSDEEAIAFIDSWLAGLGQERDKKLNAYGDLMNRFDAYAKARKEEAQRLTKMAQSDIANLDRMKTRLMIYLKMVGDKFVETKFHKFRVKGNGGQEPVDLLLDPEWIPEEFQRVTIEPDKEAIRLALKAGQELGFAVLGQRGEHLEWS
jgi:hypothetical protein